MNWKLVIIAGLILLSSTLYAEKPTDKALPFHGTLSGYLIAFNEDPDAIADRCNPPAGQVAWAIASFDGWGDVTHMGWTYGYFDHCSYRPENGPPIGEYGEGEARMIASNGDVLTATYTGGTSIPQPPMFYFMDYYTFDDGGDGRFNFASGVGVDIGWLNMSDGSFEIEMKGVISYRKR